MVYRASGTQKSGPSGRIAICVPARNVIRIKQVMAQGKTILVVDDSATVREIVGDALREVGFTVHEASDGEEGLQKAKALRPDVVILDLTMPKRDGLDVATDLRADPNTAKVKIIMLTVRDSEFDQMVGRELGADRYLPKPFDSQTLLDAVLGILK